MFMLVQVASAFIMVMIMMKAAPLSIVVGGTANMHPIAWSLHAPLFLLITPG